LPPPLAAPDPAERLGIDRSRLRTPQGVRQAIGAVFAAVSRGDITPAEALRIARSTAFFCRAD
jgi:hypothetical protein